MKLFDIAASRELGERLARRLECPLAAHEERAFEGRELKIRPLESVRGESVLVCQSLSPDSSGSVNDKLMRLVIFVGALRDAAAARITAIAPYLAYQRKDRRTRSRDPVTTRYVAQMLESVGLDAIVAVDVHNRAAFDNAFRIVAEHIEAAPLFVEHFLPLAKRHEKVVVVSPDVGGVGRARAFAALLGERAGRAIETAFVEKHRSAGIVSGDLFAGDVENGIAIIIDDMVCGGTTMVRAAERCRTRGAVAVHAAATHGLFDASAATALGTPQIESVVITDTVPDAAARCPPLQGKLTVLPAADLIAAAVKRLAGRP